MLVLDIAFPDSSFPVHMKGRWEKPFLEGGLLLHTDAISGLVEFSVGTVLYWFRIYEIIIFPKKGN
jgi:hypothetical protein